MPPAASLESALRAETGGKLESMTILQVRPSLHLSLSSGALAFAFAARRCGMLEHVYGFSE